LARISRESNVSVVVGTGFYTVEFAGGPLADLSQEQIGRRLFTDLRRGIGNTDIRAGFIGEMGLSTPPHPDEIKALKAAARTQNDTGAGVCIHPPRDPEALCRMVALIKDNGGQVEKTAIAHLERTLPTVEDYLELAQTGCFLELDFFGLESGFYPFAPCDLPNDAGRLAIIRALIDRPTTPAAWPSSGRSSIEAIWDRYSSPRTFATWLGLDVTAARATVIYCGMSFP
jgi:phosphotriesterase-related protein